MAIAKKFLTPGCYSSSETARNTLVWSYSQLDDTKWLLEGHLPGLLGEP
jgi:hypothetical protein